MLLVQTYISRFALLFVALLCLQGCGDRQAAPARLAKEISRQAEGRVVARNIEVVGAHTTGTIALKATSHEATFLGDAETAWQLEFSQWECAGNIGSPKSCGRHAGVPVAYDIDPKNVDPRSIVVSAPRGEEDEIGYAVAFGCANGADLKCIRRSEFIETGGYAPCATRECTLEERLAESNVDRIVKTRSDELRRFSIACASEKACGRLAAKFRQLIDVASGRTFISTIAEMEDAVARLDRASREAVFVEDPVDGSVPWVAGHVTAFADRTAYRGKGIRFDPDGHLNMAYRLCIEDTEAGCDTAHWLHKISHVALQDVNPSLIDVFDLERIKVKGKETVFDGAEVFFFCRENSGCSSNDGIDANLVGSPPFFPCKDKESCAEAEADFAGLVSFATTKTFEEWRASQEKMAYAPMPIAKQRDVKNALRELTQGFAGEQMTLPAPDRDLVLHPFEASLYLGQFLVVKAESCPAEASCGDADDFSEFTMSYDLRKINDGSIKVSEVEGEGMRSSVSMSCVNAMQCTAMRSHELWLRSARSFLPCNHVETCWANLRRLRGLVAHAKEGGLEGYFSKTKSRKLGALARELTKAAEGGRYAQTSNGTLTEWRFVRVGVLEKKLLLWLQRCDRERNLDCGLEANWRDQIVAFRPEEVQRDRGYAGIFDAEGQQMTDFEAVVLEDDPEMGPSGYAISFACNDNAMCADLNGLEYYLSNVTFPCPSFEACGEIEKVLSGSAGDVKPEKADEEALERDPSPGDDPLRDLNTAVAGAEISLPAQGSDVARPMRGVEVMQGTPRTLIVRRQACLALVRWGQARGNECSLDTLFRDYDLELDLRALKRSSLKVRKGRSQRGEDGVWLEASCERSEPCAKLLRPERPAHRALEFDTIAQSYGESIDAPNIRMPCTDERACNDAVGALRGLVKQARKAGQKKDDQKPAKIDGEGSAGVDPRFVGSWALTLPQQTRWVWEFREDGTYTFTNDQTRFSGSYRAKDGVWSQKAIDVSSEDNGTYRFRDADTLELTGRLGLSTWKRLR